MHTLRPRDALLTGLVLLIAGCGAASLRSTDVQDQIAEELGKQAGASYTVTCPAEIPAEKGFTFTCTASDGSSGETATITVVEDDDLGTFSWKVATVSTP
jgi:hypothetical protein